MSSALPTVLSSKLPPAARAVIVFMVVMGICILAGMAFIVSQIMHRLDDKTQAPNVVAATGVIPFQKTNGIELPVGTQIMQLVPHGDQLIIWARVPQEGERLIMVDTQRAHVTGEMRVTYKGK